MWIFLDKYDTFWLIVYVVYMLCFTVIPAFIVIQHELPPASSLIVLMEQVKIDKNIKLTYRI